MKLIFRGTPDYDAARTRNVFNSAQPARYPDAVAFPEHADDVAAAVRLARERGWRIALRSGGHSWAVWSVRDAGLLIDLSRMRDMSYDPATQCVSVSPAVRGGEELNPFLAQYGRFFTGGHCPSVGVGGFLLQGGMGWNARAWGWAAEYLEAIDVVTADGELRHASATENPDLFWAARGSGPGFFGVVTRFHLRTRPLPKALTESVLVFPKEAYHGVFAWLHGMHRELDPCIELVALGLVPPGGAEAQIVVPALALADTPEQARAALEPFARCPLASQSLMHVQCQPTTFAEQLTRQIAQNPPGYRYAADNAWLTGPDGDVIDRMHDAFVTLPTPTSYSLWFSMAPLRTLPDMALSLQTEVYFASYVNWTDPAADARCRAWQRERMRTLEPVTLGQYLGDSDFTTRRVKFMSDAAYQRLERLRAQHDPDRMFQGYLARPGEVLNTNEWTQI